MFKKISVYGKIILIFAVVLSLGIFTKNTYAAEGDVWLTPVNQNVSSGTGFDLEVHADTGGNNLGGFNITLNFDATNVTIDTSQGTDGVDKGTDASDYIISVNSTDISSGTLTFAGITTSGYANGTDVHIATIHASTTSSFTSGTSDLSLTVNELLDENSYALNSGTVTGATVTYPVTDTTPPTLAEVTAVSSPTSDSTPNYTFSSTEAGNITYGGSCSSSTTQATVGNNTITFNTLTDGTYSDCTVTVTDASGNSSDALSVSSFVVDTSVPDTSAPTRSNRSSSKNISGNEAVVTLSLTTNENATCRYSTVANIDYDSMTSNFLTTGGTVHQTTVSGLTVGNEYIFYVKCVDSSGNKNSSDYNIQVSTVITDNDSGEGVVVSSSSDEVNIKALKFRGNNNKKAETILKKKKVYSKENKIKFKGSVEGLSSGKVNIYVDKKLKYTVNLKNGGKWSKKVKIKKDGTHTVKFEFLDGSGNVKESTKYKVKIDTKKPKFKKMLSFLNKHRGDKIWWKATDNNKVKYYKYYFNGKIRKTKRASFIVPANTPRGLHTLKIKAYDKAGNRAIKYVIIRVR